MKMNVEFEYVDEDGLNPSGLPMTFVFELEVNYNVGRPDVFYLKNGDPGYPGESAEVDVLSVNCVRQTMVFIELPSVNGEIRKVNMVDQKAANEWFLSLLDDHPSLIDEIAEKCED